MSEPSQFSLRNCNTKSFVAHEWMDEDAENLSITRFYSNSNTNAHKKEEQNVLALKVKIFHNSQHKYNKIRQIERTKWMKAKTIPNFISRQTMWWPLCFETSFLLPCKNQIEVRKKTHTKPKQAMTCRFLYTLCRHINCSSFKAHLWGSFSWIKTNQGQCFASSTNMRIDSKLLLSATWILLLFFLFAKYGR